MVTALVKPAERPKEETHAESERGPPALRRPGITDGTRARAKSEEPPRRLQFDSLAEAQRELRPVLHTDNTMSLGLPGKKKMADMAGHCIACHTDNRGHYAHLHKGDCLKKQPEPQLPSSFHSLGEEAGPKEDDKAALADYGPSAQGCHGIVNRPPSM